MTAAEARARGTHQALTPVVDVAREPRWGRVEETFGEDPYLVARMGVAAVRGFQGDATFRGQAARDRHPEALRRARPARVGHQLRAGQRLDARAARDVPFDLQGGDPGRRRAQRDAVLQRNRRRPVARQPLAAARTCSGGEWGFRGFTVSDYFAIRELNERPELLRPPLAHDAEGGRGARRPRGRRHRAAGSRLLPAPRRAGARGHDPGIADRRARAADAPREVPAGAVRRSVRRSGRGRAHRPRAVAIASSPSRRRARRSRC